MDVNNQTLNLHFDTQSELSEYDQVIGFIKTNAPFTWNSATFSGSYIVGSYEGSSYTRGTFTATLVIP
jgi:uncharacterized membrane protein